MKVSELVQQAKEKEFQCSPDVIAKYTEAGLLPVPIGGGRGRGNAAQYPEEALPKLLLLLKLRQEYPAGFGVYYNDALFDFIGRGEEADLLLPALLYIMEIPDANADAAREAALKVLWSDNGKFLKDIKRLEHRTDAIPAMLSIAQGNRAYQDPELFSSPDDRDDDKSPTLLDELRETVPEFQFIGNALEENDLAMLARVNDPKRKAEAVQQTSEEILLLAAFVARFYLRQLKERFRPPYGNALVHCWLFALSGLRQYPQMIEVVKMARYLLPLALPMFQEIDVPKRGTTFEEVFNIAIKAAEKCLTDHFKPTDTPVG
jgi:hypothetical protein